MTTAERFDALAGVLEENEPSLEIDLMIGKEIGGVDPRVTLQLGRPAGYVDRGQWASVHLPFYTTSIDAAAALIRKVLPDWYWTAGHCKLTGHATIGPDRSGCDAKLLADRIFDQGFDVDLAGARPARALCIALLRACAELERRGRRVGP